MHIAKLVLVKGGYKVTACQPFDLFPHTEHIETIVALATPQICKNP